MPAVSLWRHPLVSSPIRQIARLRRRCSIAPGVILQYRRNKGPGTWGVRLTSGKDETHRVATADDYADADGRDVLDYWRAQDAARAKAKEHEGGVEPITVTKALADYEADLTTRDGDSGNVKRARVHLSPEMLARTVSSLKAGDLKAWRDRLNAGRPLFDETFISTSEPAHADTPHARRSIKAASRS